MKKIIVKQIAITILSLLVAMRLSMPAIILADSTTPTPTNTPTPTTTQANQTTVNNSANATNSTNSTANTGNNSVSATPTVSVTPTESPTPTDTPTVSPTSDPSTTPTPDPTIDPNATASSTLNASNSADITNTQSSTANTGQNSTTSNSGNNTSNTSPTSNQPATDSATPTPSPQVTVQTGNGVSVVAGDNTINTTAVNSNVSDQTINIFGDQTGNIDLSTLFQLVSNIITNDQKNDPVINVQVTGVNNYAYLSNTVVSTANTGGNSLNANTGDAIVTTGNAESVVSLINKVNLTVVNSSLHLVTINIFGHLSGNIILPNIAPLQSTSCTSCGVSFNTQNQAVVNNTVSSTADTGNNTTTASNSADVTTGNATSEVNTVNLVNQTALGMILENLFINEFGNWNGSFIGWDGFAPQANGDLALSSQTTTGDTNTPSGTISNTSVSSTAYINNIVDSLAQTGNNTVNGQNATVHTGNAYSAVSLINLINSNFFNTLGFFGFINIFGNWDGSIGGANEFAALTPTPTPDTLQQSSGTSNVQESGGQLSVQNSNNVGAFVLPGDTVTFFLMVKNTGIGKVYGSKLNLTLMQNGENVGETTFDLGDIPVGRGVKITTGLVISKDAAPGVYTAVATATGTTGPDNTSVSASTNSTFQLLGTEQTATRLTAQPTPTSIPHQAVLAVRTNKPTPTSDTILVFLLGMSLTSYFTLKGLRNRGLIRKVWNSPSFKQKLLAIRLLLL